MIIIEPIRTFAISDIKSYAYMYWITDEVFLPKTYFLEKNIIVKPLVFSHCSESKIAIIISCIYYTSKLHNIKTSIAKCKRFKKAGGGVNSESLTFLK